MNSPVNHCYSKRLVFTQLAPFPAYRLFARRYLYTDITNIRNFVYIDLETASYGAKRVVGCYVQFIAEGHCKNLKL
jgi:hypothetical protein